MAKNISPFPLKFVSSFVYLWPILFLGCSGSDSGDNGISGSNRNFTIAQSVVSGTGPGSSDSRTLQPLICQFHSLRKGIVETFTYSAHLGSCLDPNNGKGALAKLGFSEKEIYLLNEWMAKKNRPDEIFDLNADDSMTICPTLLESTGDPDHTACASIPRIVEGVPLE